MAKTIWEVVDSKSAPMRSMKKVLFRSESLRDCRKFVEGMPEHIRIRTKPESRSKKDEGE